MIIARAPTRIGIFGGGTDVNPFAKEYGGKVLNMAINLRHECEIDDDLFFPEHVAIQTVICAMGETRDITQLGGSKFRLIKKILDSYELPKKEFNFVDEFDGIQSAGLGSSASAAVSMIGAFNRWLGIDQTRREIAEKAYRMERELGWASGRQDQFASAYGGMNFFEFDEDVWHEAMPRDIAQEFRKWCVLVYTGKTRHSAKIQDKLVSNMKNKKTIEALKKLRTQTWHAREAMKRGRFDDIGLMMHESWIHKKESNPACTNEKIDDIYTMALKTGALGGKVCGAGGEGHVLFVAPPEIHAQILEAIGLKKIDFDICFQGLEVRSV